MKKILSILLSICMVTGVFLPSASYGAAVQPGEIPTENPIGHFVYSGPGFEIIFQYGNLFHTSYQGIITIHNTGSHPITDWELDFQLEHEISTLLYAKFLSRSQSQYTIGGLGLQKEILPGKSHRIVYYAKRKSKETIAPPTKYTLRGVDEEEIPPEEAPIDLETDTDNDGIPDYFEEDLGSDPLLADTDGDGLGDKFEIQYLLDPASPDSDNDGILDPQEDEDQDGLLNLEEYQLGTDALSKDSDGDQLEDGKEVHQYHTDPLCKDTDGDDLSDYEEVCLQLNPLQKTSDGKTPDSQRLFHQRLGDKAIAKSLRSPKALLSPQLTGEFPGLLDLYVNIESSNNDSFYNNRSLVGDVIEIQSRYGMKAPAQLSWDVSQIRQSKGEIYTKELVICQIDKEEGLIPLSTTLQGDQISAQILFPGDFLVLNASDFLKHLGIPVPPYSSGASSGTPGEAPTDPDPMRSVSWQGIGAKETSPNLPAIRSADDDAAIRSSILGDRGEISAPGSRSFSGSTTPVAEPLGPPPNISNHVPSQGIPGEPASPSQESTTPSSVSLPSPGKQSLPREPEGSPRSNPAPATTTPKPSTMAVADIVFVLDSTGSMGDEIKNVEKNINFFVQQLVDVHGVNANFALIDYKDIEDDGAESTVVHSNGHSSWFSMYDQAPLLSRIQGIQVVGGGDGPESAIDALETARRLSWRSNAAKFIILVTDAPSKVANRYQLASMDQEIALLLPEDLTVCVVSDLYWKSDYAPLFTKTDGLFANINGDFAQELLGILEKIGQKTKGQWILLDDFQIIRLNPKDQDPDGDTDDDGIKDFDELGSKKEVSVRWALDQVKNARKQNASSSPDGSGRSSASPEDPSFAPESVPLPGEGTSAAPGETGWAGTGPKILDPKTDPDWETYWDQIFGIKKTVSLYPYRSLPVIQDTDYDGIPDPFDKRKRDNTFSCNVDHHFTDKETFSMKNQPFAVDYRQLFHQKAGKEAYRPILHTLSALYATLAYDAQITILGEGVYTIDTMMGNFGLRDVRDISLGAAKDAKPLKYARSQESKGYTDDDLSEVILGHIPLVYQGKEREVVLAVIRGTNGTLEEWSSNFDVGADTPEYWDQKNPHWRNKEHHKGFDVAANRIQDILLQYMSQLGSNSEKILLVTGHSRGGAIANILCKNLQSQQGFETYGYTFAAPNVTTNPGPCPGLFNTINEDDMVTEMPLRAWGFGRYGSHKSISVGDNYENLPGEIKKPPGTFEWLLNEEDYNDNGQREKTIAALSAIAKTREDVYRWDIAPIVENKMGHEAHYPYATMQIATKKQAQILESLPPRLRKHIRFDIVPAPGDSGYLLRYYQCPAYFMAYLGDLTINTTKTLQYPLSPKYAEARKLFVLSGCDRLWIGGMKDPHLPETYYLISLNDFKELKKPSIWEWE